LILRKGVRKGEELKAPRYASAAASCDDHMTIYDIIPNKNLREVNKVLKVETEIVTDSMIINGQETLLNIISITL
jgi:hypothetical protein